MSAFYRAAPVFLVAVTSSLTALAAEPEAVRCALAAERGQQERDEGQLLESRATFASCGEGTCPAVVQRECVRWLTEVDERIPTIVVSVKDGAGKDVLNAALTIDDRPLVAANQGRELRVDPGQHRIAAKRADGAKTEETLVIREREKGRMVDLVLETPAVAPKVSALAPRRQIPLFSWILAGTAAVGGAGFAYFWSKGVDQVHELRGTCAPRCGEREVDDAALLLGAGRVSLGIGIAAAVGALIVYVFQPDGGSGQVRSASALGVHF